MMSGKKDINLFASTFAVILYKTLHKAIGLKYFTVARLLVFGISTTVCSIIEWLACPECFLTYKREGAEG